MRGLVFAVRYALQHRSAGGGQIGVRGVGVPRNSTRWIVERFSQVLMMWLCVQLYIPVYLFAQNEATLGKWERLYGNWKTTGTNENCQVSDFSLEHVVRWRFYECRPTNWRTFWEERFATRDQVWYAGDTRYAADNHWQDIFGIHAALLPVSGETGVLRHGWVMLWGYGKERGYLRDRAYLTRLFGRAVDASYLLSGWVSRVALTPVLLWHPDDPEEQQAGQPYELGYVRYLFDAKLDGTGYEEWDPPADDPNWYGSWPIFNLFCSGHAFLHDGQLLAVGGHGGLWGNETPQEDEDSVGYVGLRLVARFDGSAFTRSNVALQQSLWSWGYSPPLGLHEPRWYPSVVALSDGKVLIVGGTVEGLWDREDRHLTNYHEIFDPCTGTVTQSEWRIPYDERDENNPNKGYGGLRENYPRLHLVSFVQDGQLRSRVVYTGPRVETYYLDNPSLPASVWQAYRVDPTDPTSFIRRAVSRSSGTSVLLPNPVENPQGWQDQVLYRVLTIGGSGDRSGSLTLSYDLNDFSNGNLSIFHYSLPYRPRVHLNAVLLPTGQVLVVGGHETYRADGSWSYPDDVVLQTLLYTPPVDSSSPGRWEVVAPAPNTDADGDGIMDGTRVYHSTALLLPDGRVLTAGSATSDSADREVNNRVPTLYSPPYLFKADGTPRGENDRPRILSLSHTELNYGQNFEITYQLADESQGIRSVVLMRPGSVTHSFNFEQRLVRLHFKLEDPTLLATAPWDPAIAPPGWYMLFLVDGNGVPSKAAWVRLKHSCPPGQPAQLTIALEGVQGVSAEQAEAIEHSPITLAFRDVATGVTRASYTLPMARPDEQGQVVLRLWSDLPAGVYELYVHPYRSWLGRRGRINWQPGGAYTILLRNGDVVKDNAVDYEDMIAVLTQQGLQGLCEADVNCDGAVNEEDAALVATNVGTQGDG